MIPIKTIKTNHLNTKRHLSTAKSSKLQIRLCCIYMTIFFFVTKVLDLNTFLTKYGKKNKNKTKQNKQTNKKTLFLVAKPI